MMMETTTAREKRETIRVLCVDDHDLLRDGIRISLLTSGDIEIIGEARSGEEALRLCAELTPDVVLMDMQLPRMNGIETTRALRADHPQVQVLVLTSFVEDSLVQEAIQAGAVGYLSKAASRVELADAIRAANAGQTTLSNEAMQALFRATKSPQSIGNDLTARQRDVLREMVAGRNNNEIGEKLFLSASTVSYHVSEILSKLNAANRAEAAALAVRHDLV
jgi:NarL family two-component system response regulator LiaR